LVEAAVQLSENLLAALALPERPGGTVRECLRPYLPGDRYFGHAGTFSRSRIAVKAMSCSALSAVASVASVAAPVGSGSEATETAPLTGCVTPEPSTGTRVARSCASVSGPETGTVPEIATVPDTGWVAGKLPTLTVPDTGCVAGKFEAEAAPLTGGVPPEPSTGPRGAR